MSYEDDDESSMVDFTYGSGILRRIKHFYNHDRLASVGLLAGDGQLPRPFVLARRYSKCLPPVGTPDVGSWRCFGGVNKVPSRTSAMTSVYEGNARGYVVTSPTALERLVRSGGDHTFSEVFDGDLLVHTIPLDVDDADQPQWDDDAALDLAERFRRVLSKELGELPDEPDVYSSVDSAKLSLHVYQRLPRPIANMAALSSMMTSLRQVFPEMRYVDLSVYGSGKSLRLPGCCKMSDGKAVRRLRRVGGDGLLHVRRALAHYDHMPGVSRRPYDRPDVPMDRHLRTSTGGFERQLSEEELSKIVSAVERATSLRTTRTVRRGEYLFFDTDERHCPMSGRLHRTCRQKLQHRLGTDVVRRKCWSPGCRHKFEDTVFDTTRPST